MLLIIRFLRFIIRVVLHNMAVQLGYNGFGRMQVHLVWKTPIQVYIVSFTAPKLITRLTKSV
jgi:hypothetical protein